MKNQFFALVFFVGCFHLVLAQKAPIKFGNVNKTDLMMKVYPADTSAPAVILCDYGYFNSQTFQTTRLLRIKILKKEGYDWANQTFDLDSKAMIRGRTYNLVNDEIEETKLKNESIFKTRITEDKYEMRVAMPNVYEGSIIDIEFTYDLIPDEWNFQEEIPVLHSELVIDPSIYIQFHKNFFGYEPLKIITNERWVAENVPAFKPEPYLTSSKNYRSRFEFDIESITIPGRFFHDYTSSWDAVRNFLMEYNYFGIPLNADGYMRSTAKEIKESSTSQQEMIDKAYNFVKGIKWDKKYRLFTEKNMLNTVVKDKKGNSAEINLALVQLLRRLELKAEPIVLSTRSNGMLSQFRPSLSKLNYVIAAVFTEKDTLLLDATDENCPLNLLPMRVLNGQGQLMAKNATGWIPIKTNKKDKMLYMADLVIDNNQKISGKINTGRIDYAALNFRDDYEDFNSDDEYLKDYKEGKTGLKIISHKIDNLDSLNLPVNEQFEVEIKNAFNEINGELYLTPMLFEQMTNNPFKIPDRKYPIDFGYQRERNYILTYTIPEGTIVSSLPESASMKLPNDAATFICKTSVSEGKIWLNYKMTLNKSIFYLTEYADLREFYNQIIKKEAEPIILKMK